jgi:transcription termination/antitermination protein NusA
VVREPGARTKIAVASNDADIDPVGACVGVRGSRIQNVVKELRGEKIDIVSWHIDPAKFVCNALSPAQVSRVIMDVENSSMEVIVSDDTHSQAIGRRGQNVKLASKLTGWHLDVVGESIYNKIMEKGYGSLLEIPGVDEKIATAMCEMGFFSAEDVSNAKAQDLLEVEGVDEETAQKLIEMASRLVEKAKTDGEGASPDIEAKTDDADEQSGPAPGDSGNGTIE